MSEQQDWNVCCDSNMTFSENDYFRFVAYYLYFHNDLSLSLGLKQLVQIYLWSLNVMDEMLCKSW